MRGASDPALSDADVERPEVADDPALRKLVVRIHQERSADQGSPWRRRDL